MPILKTSDTVSSTTFFGGYLSKDMISYINLYCLAKGISKSNLMRKVVKVWTKKVKKEITEGILFNEIVDRIVSEWDVSELDHTTFTNKIRKELAEKNIQPAYINGIMEAFKDETQNSK